MVLQLITNMQLIITYFCSCYAADQHYHENVLATHAANAVGICFD